jgi:uncharacterized UPF0160 family protein
MTDEFAAATVIRTSDPSLLNSADAFVNTGAIYDHEKRRYDHHQPGFDAKYPGEELIPLSAAGLIYLNFGGEILTRILSATGRVIGPHLNYLLPEMYRHYVREVDAVENGIPLYPPEAAIRYINHTGISERIDMWNTEGTFDDAISVVTEEFITILFRIFDSEIPAVEIVKAAFESRHEFHESGQLLLFDVSCPYLKHMKALETETQANPILFIVCPRNGGTWGVNTVPTGSGFERRKDLPFPGLNNEELANASGVDGAIFVHKAAFTSAFKTREGAIAFARIAIAQPDPEPKT